MRTLPNWNRAARFAGRKPATSQLSDCACSRYSTNGSTLPRANGLDMAETLVGYIERRKRELRAELASAEAVVLAIRGELQQLRNAEQGIANGQMALITQAYQAQIDANSGVDETPINPDEVLPPVPTPNWAQGLADIGEQFGFAEAHRRTIKEHVLLALDQHVDFRRNGATTGELKRYIKSEFEKDIEVTSLSPQLSRLRDDGIISFVDGRWRIKPRLNLYTKLK